MPRKQLKKTLGALALCSGLVVPAAASADRPPVSEQIRSADTALAKAETLVAHNKDALAAVQMARANAETRGAAAAAAGLATAAEARAERRVARQFNENAETFAQLVDEVDDGSQSQVARAIEGAVRGRDRAVEQLTSLLDQVPAQAVPGITKAIAAVAGDTDVVDELSQALERGEIAPEAEAAVEDALARVQSSMQAALDRLSSVVSQLPPEAQGYVQQAQEQLASILGSIGGLVGGGGSFGGGNPSGAGPPF